MSEAFVSVDERSYHTFQCVLLTTDTCNREVKIDVYGRPVTANAKLQVGFEGKFYKFSKVSTSF